MERPDIRTYTDFRIYLKDWAFYSQSRNSRWSYGVWARKMGLSSKSSLIMILNGSRNPGPQLVKRLLHSLELNAEEAAQFKRLVAIQKSNLQEFFRVLVEKPETRAGSAQVRASRWLMLVLRELITFPQFEETTEWLSEKLGIRISPEQFGCAVDALVEEDILRRDSLGKLVIGNSKKSNPWSKDEIREFHRQVSEASTRAFEAAPLQLRAYHSSFLRVRKDRISDARALLEKFKNDMESLLDEAAGETADAVYQLNLQLFPIVEFESTSR